MRWLIIAVAAVALVIAAAGCGGGDEESSATTDTAVLTETNTVETTTEETTPDLSGVLGSEECIKLVAALASLGQAFAAPGSGDDASDFFGNFDPPDEIKDDIQTLSEWYQAYAAAVKNAGFEPGTTPSADQLQRYQEALAGLDQTGVSEASERIGTWANENCQG